MLSRCQLARQLSEGSASKVVNPSLTWLASECLLLAGNLHFFYFMAFSLGSLECPHDVAAGFPQSNRSRESKAEARVSFLTQHWQSHCHFRNVLLVTQRCQLPCNGNYREHEYQDMRITSGGPGGWLPTTGRACYYSHQTDGKLRPN